MQLVCIVCYLVNGDTVEEMSTFPGAIGKHSVMAGLQNNDYHTGHCEKQMT